MAKKEKVHVQASDDLEAVDAELANAMELLDKANDKVVELLQTYAPPPPEEAQTETAPEQPPEIVTASENL